MKTHAERWAAIDEDVALRMLENRLNGAVFDALAEAVDDVARAFPTVRRWILAREAIEALADASTANVRREKLMAPHTKPVRLA